MLGQPFKGECPEGFLFNMQKSQCDLPEYVNCESQTDAVDETKTKSEEEYEEYQNNVNNNDFNDEYD